MKVTHLFERSQRVPFGVELEREVENDETGIPDVHTFDVYGYVTVGTDPFNTGDSPTEYDVYINGLVDKTTGQKIAKPYAFLSAKEVDWVENEAIRNIND